jgi:membrane protein insertase Oxa1/YidC/SpoIIIJ
LLPIIMVVMWVLQQATMPKPTDEQAAKMQRIMMFMPVMMGFFLYNYAAGLSLYMITQSTLGIFEQKVIKKVWPVDDTEVVKKKKSGCGPFAGAMEKLAEKQKEQMKLIEAQQAMKKKGKAKRKRS